jgi:hypothetical protein
MHILKNIDCTKCSMSGYLINGIIEGLFHNSLPSCPSCVIWIDVLKALDCSTVLSTVTVVDDLTFPLWGWVSKWEWLDQFSLYGE